MSEGHLPELGPVGDGDRAAAGGNSSSLYAGVRRHVGGHPVDFVDPADTEHERVEAEPLEGHLGEVPGYHEFSGTDIAAGGDEAHVVVVRQVDERADAQRHHRHRPAPQSTPDLGGGGAGVEGDRLAVSDKGSDGNTDPLLCLGSLECPDDIGLLVGSQAGGQGRAVNPANHAVALEKVQISADCHL